MHGVLERYFKLAEASNMAVGCRANLNNPLRKEYAISNPYFDYTDIDNEVEREAMENKINEFLNAWLPPTATKYAKELAKVLFTSICYYKQYLE